MNSPSRKKGHNGNSLFPGFSLRPSHCVTGYLDASFQFQQTLHHEAPDKILLGCSLVVPVTWGDPSAYW